MSLLLRGGMGGWGWGWGAYARDKIPQQEFGLKCRGVGGWGIFAGHFGTWQPGTKLDPFILGKGCG